MTVIERFARFAVEATPPLAARQAAALCLLDWAGAAIAGADEMPATALRRVLPGGGTARLWPDGAAVEPRTAALINGTASHIVEVDDIFRPGLYHPGVVTIPAALALGEAAGVSGARLIDAIIAGYEVGNRIAMAVNPAHYRFWHTTGTVGHFGAAAAGAVALGLDARQTAHALATAATFAAGLRHAFSADAMSKPLHAGRAAEAGVLAALAAREGVTGVADMLDGARGLGAAMADGPDWDPATADLGQRWTVTEITPKAHACCGHNFAALDALAALRAEADLTAATRIEVASYQAARDICCNPDPQSPAEARFSLPWCAAAMARRGAVMPEAVSAEALACPETRALAGRISVTVSEAAEAAFPGARSATVTVHLADGRTLTHHRPTRKGDPDDPLSEAEVAAKFRALAAPVIGPERAADLEARLRAIDCAGTLSGLLG